MRRTLGHATAGPRRLRSPSVDVERLLNEDRRRVWHPYAPMPALVPPLPIVAAEGVRLRLADGRELVDGMSSWWAAIHGYRHPVLDAVHRLGEAQPHPRRRLHHQGRHPGGHRRVGMPDGGAVGLADAGRGQLGHGHDRQPTEAVRPARHGADREWASPDGVGDPSV